jgi:hypothetical protein
MDPSDTYQCEKCGGFITDDPGKDFYIEKIKEFKKAG